jgi:transglutaminase-like putative cysteine protease
MNRRDFLQAAGTVAAGLACSSPKLLRGGSTAWRTFEVTTQVEVLKPSGMTRVWLPAALIANTPFQRTLANTVHCDSGVSKTVDNNAEALGIVVAEFPSGTRPVVTVTSRVETANWAVDFSTPGKARKVSPAELKNALKATQLLPTGGIVKETADKITRAYSTDVQKARAIYEWIVENTYRNPKTKGCGIGDIRFMLESGDLGGKCADLNALYVGLARACGLPARDVYGIRVAKSELGYQSLGASSEKISKAQHCRAEVYLNEYGWVPVDPADVRKVMLEEPPGNRPADDEMVEKARARLFGSWEMNWMAYNYAHDVALPGSSGKPLGYLMYPQAETADGRVDSLNPETFRYEITAREVSRG